MIKTTIRPGLAVLDPEGKRWVVDSPAFATERTEVNLVGDDGAKRGVDITQFERTYSVATD